MKNNNCRPNQGYAVCNVNSTNNNILNALLVLRSLRTICLNTFTVISTYYSRFKIRVSISTYQRNPTAMKFSSKAILL